MNKYFYLCAAGLLTLSVARAQIKKGDVLLGGNLGFSKQDADPLTVNNAKASVITVYPSFGKAVRDNLVVGINLIYRHTSSETMDGVNPLYTLKDNAYGLGFFIRRYKSLSHGFSVFLEGDLQGAYNEDKGVYEGVPAPSVDEKGFSINASLYGGIAYNITPRWQLETGFRNLVSAGYGHTKDDGTSTGDRKIDYYGLSSSLSNSVPNISIGCKFIL